MKTAIEKERELEFIEYKQSLKELNMYIDLYKITKIHIDVKVNSYTGEILYPNRDIKSTSNEYIDNSTKNKILDLHFLVSSYLHIY